MLSAHSILALLQVLAIPLNQNTLNQDCYCMGVIENAWFVTTGL